MTAVAPAVLATMNWATGESGCGSAGGRAGAPCQEQPARPPSRIRPQNWRNRIQILRNAGMLFPLWKAFVCGFYTLSGRALSTGMAGWKGEEARKVGEEGKTFFGRGKRPHVSSFFLFFLLFSPSAIPLQGLLTLSSPWLMMVLRLEEGNVWIWNCATGNDCRLISWSSQRAINKTPQPWSPPVENLEKKAVIPPCCGDKTTILYENVLPKKTQLPLLCSYSWIKFDKTAINLPELLYDLGRVVILHIIS